MDMRSWKKVLLQWINECGFMERNYFNIEQSDIDVFYQNYSLQHHKTASGIYKRLSEFLKEFYPNFDINLDDENCLSSADYIYVYSLLLHFCCVKHPETAFHEICQKLPDYSQQFIASFFKELLDSEPLTKEALRHAIAETANTQSPPPRLNESFLGQSINSSLGGLSSASFAPCESPLKTPKRSAGPQRVSPSTPKSFLLEERTRELYNLRAQLETERYEKGLLEVQIKQNEDKIQKLNNDHRRLLQQIQDLKNDIIVKTSDGSSSRDGGENQIQKRLLKELSQREEEILKLSDTARTLREEKTLGEEKLNYAEKQIVVCMNRIKELDSRVDELSEELEKQNDTIEYLTNSKMELEQFISETRASGNIRTDHNSSTDCFDSSYTPNGGYNNTNSSNSLSSPENLGASVVDVQLREKEHENQLLKEELLNVKREHKRLAKQLTKITQEFEKPPAATTTNEDIFESESDQEEPEGEVLPVSSEEQFNIFNNCMEKINKFHKTEKTKVKHLEEMTQNLQEENDELQKTLDTFKKEIENLNEKVLLKERQHEQFLETKNQLDSSLESCQRNVEHLQMEKEELYTNLQSLKLEKSSLNVQLEEMNIKLELQQKDAMELTKNFNDLKDQEETSRTQLKDIQEKFSKKTFELENEIQNLTGKVQQQMEEIKLYQKTEETLKKNYEQIIIQNDNLQKQATEADKHLREMKKELLTKEHQISNLGEEIKDFTEKNYNLEENIKRLMEEFKQERETLDHQTTKQQNYVHELEDKILELKENLAKEKRLMESKQRELDEVKPQIEKLLKLFDNCSIKSNIFFNLSDLEIQIKSIKEENKNLEKMQNESSKKVEDLQMQLHKKSEVLKQKYESLQKSSNEIEKLEKDLKEKTEALKKNVESLESYTKNNERLEKELKANTDLLKQKSDSLEAYEKKIEKLERVIEEKTNHLKELSKQNLEYEVQIKQYQEKQLHFVETIKQDLSKKEQEMQERLKEAAVEYELSLERIGQELKLEKEQHSNKEMELLLIIADHSEVKKQLLEAQQIIQNLEASNKECQQYQEKLQRYETKIQECTKENEQLRLEIDTFKQQVTENALRLLEADKALTEFMELTKQQDSKQSEFEILQKSLQDKDLTLNEFEKQIEKLQQDMQKKSEEISTLQDYLKKLSSDKEKLLKEADERIQQIQREQQDKISLLHSLENSADQMKLLQDEINQQKITMEQNYVDLKQQFNDLTLQNTKLQGDLVEREAELQQGKDELKQEKEQFQQDFSQLKQQLAQKSEQLESLDMALMEVLATMENNFNLSLELVEDNLGNLFNYDGNKENNFQKLRQYLNKLLYAQQQLQYELNEMTKEKEQAYKSQDNEKMINLKLQKQLQKQEQVVRELKEQLDNEGLVMEKKISQEVKRLEDDLLNLEKVNERLAQENVKIQVSLDDAQQEFKDSKIKISQLEEEKLQLQEDVRSKTLALEKIQQSEKKLQLSLKEKCQLAEKITEKSKQFESQCKEKSSKLQNVEKDYKDLKEKSQKAQQKLTHYQSLHYTQEIELKNLREKLQTLQTCNDSLELDVTSKNKELLSIKNKNSEISQQLKEKEEQLNITSQKLDKVLSDKLNAETKCEQLLSETHQLKRDLDFLKSQQQSQLNESLRLQKEIDSLKTDKEQLKDETSEIKLSLQRANDNVSQLIQQISSIRLEKESALEENQLLRKQLEETGKNQTTSESKLKTIIEKSQHFERKLLTSENELKSIKIQLGKSEVTSEKLLIENKKLRESHEGSTKRVEKLALKLGDSQAKCAKLERDNEKLSKTLESHSANLEALQKEKDLLQSEAKSLKERLSRAERAQEQLSTKVQNLEHLNASLQQIKQKLEASEIDGKIKLNKLEKMRDAHEEKIRKLTSALNNSENVNVKLNLEIGALNSELQENNKEHSQEQLHQQEELKRKLEQSQELAHKYEEINEKLKLEVHQLKEENSSLNDQLSKVSLSLEITKQKCEKMASELEQIRADLLIMRQEKSQIELQHETSIQKLSQFETQNTKLVHERKNLVKTLEQRISSLEEELASKSKEIGELQKEIAVLKENSESNSSLLQQTTSSSLLEVEQLRSKLFLANDTIEKEQQLIKQLRQDNQILHTKYQESKQRALDAATTSEERIKENRLELEGKLEKMKNKMKTLYTEEITKMKTKQERETALLKSEMEILKAQNAKYEEHIRKLSNQIVRLNDNILEHQKENAMLSTKLKHIMEQQHHESERFKRPSSIHVSSTSSNSLPAAAANNIGTNLAMEDEEGEVFNNTYLTDLKNGRMSELMNREVCAEEIKFRNSLLPPHLRSTYAAQYDHDLPEDDLKDGPNSLDDSMSALLSTTAGGTRKKCTGVTHYKRPGPPTPSKNGGRLSFGGSSEPCREILKESFDTNTGSSAVSSSKTPARFNFFASRFSMGTTRDEKPMSKPKPENKPLLVKTESDEIDLRKALQKQSLKTNRKLLNGVGYTSTPRKSKIHFDQRRLIDQLMTSSPSPSPLTIEHKIKETASKITPPDVSIIETPLTALDHRGQFIKAPLQYKSNAKRIEAIAGGLRRNRRNSSIYGRRLSRRMQEICTPTSGETTSPAVVTPKRYKPKTQKVVCSSQTTTSGGVGKTVLLQRRLRKRPKREKGARPSLYLRGNIFAKYRTPNKGAIHDLNRYKSKKQRLEHFNRGRNMKSLKIESQEENDQTISVKAIRDRTFDLKNNNYTTFNHNKLGETVIIAKSEMKVKKEEPDTFTFAEEVFESQDLEELDYMEDYESDEDFENDEADDDDDDDIYYGKDNDMKYDFPIKEEKECYKQELITTQDLEEFDRFVERTKQIKPENEEIDEESYASNGSSQQFEKLLIETESNAPFEIKQIQFNVTKCSRSSRSHSFRSSLSHSNPSINSISQQDYAHQHNDHNISTATPHHSPSNPLSAHLSRTIYGGTVIYNHRLPNINTTYVRKSSIYVKNRNKSSSQYPHQMDSSSCNDVVLITNQTITLVDLMRMWSQMDSSTRIIVSFAALASLTTLFGLFVSFCSKR